MFSYDFLLSSVFLIFLLGLFLFSSTALLNQIDEAELEAEMSESVQLAANSLMRTPGDPSNWEIAPINETGTRSLGLAGSSGELDSEKVERFFSISSDGSEYNATMQILGLTRRSYRFNATLEYLNGTAIASIQRTPSGNPARIVSIERYAVLNGTKVAFKMVVWDE